MKKLLRIFGLVYIIALFGGVLTIASKSFDIKSQHVISQTSDEKVSANFIKSVLCSIFSSENNSNRVNNLPILRLKSPFALSVAIEKVSEDLLQLNRKNYLLFSEWFLIRHRKTDIIFPFHYHW